MVFDVSHVTVITRSELRGFLTCHKKKQPEQPQAPCLKQRRGIQVQHAKERNHSHGQDVGQRGSPKALGQQRSVRQFVDPCYLCCVPLRCRCRVGLQARLLPGESEQLPWQGRFRWSVCLWVVVLTWSQILKRAN